MCILEAPVVMMLSLLVFVVSEVYLRVWVIAYKQCYLKIKYVMPQS